MDVEKKLFFIYSIDCEPLAEKSPACGGPASWDVSARTIERFGEVFRRRGLLSALCFHTTPEAGKAHTDLLLALHREGCGLGIQPNVPGFRYPKYQYDLGFYDRDEQRRILEEATQDFADAFGFSPQSYTPCCGSKNKHTYPLLASLGYRQVREVGAGRYFPDRPDRCTFGSFPFAHWASAEHPLLTGDLPLYIIPGTVELWPAREGRPSDLRAEAPVCEETRERFKRIIDDAIEMQKHLGHPIKAVVVGSHNTERVHFENVEFVIDYTQEAAAREDLEFAPAHCGQVREAAEALKRQGD